MSDANDLRISKTHAADPYSRSEGAWTAAVWLLRRALDEWPELVCAENPEWYPGTYSEVPIATKPDF